MNEYEGSNSDSEEELRYLREKTSREVKSANKLVEWMRRTREEKSRRIDEKFRIFLRNQEEEKESRRSEKEEADRRMKNALEVARRVQEERASLNERLKNIKERIEKSRRIEPQITVSVNDTQQNEQANQIHVIPARQHKPKSIQHSKSAIYFTAAAAILALIISTALLTQTYIILAALVIPAIIGLYGWSLYKEENKPDSKFQENIELKNISTLKREAGV